MKAMYTGLVAATLSIVGYGCAAPASECKAESKLEEKISDVKKEQTAQEKYEQARAVDQKTYDTLGNDYAKKVSHVKSQLEEATKGDMTPEKAKIVRMQTERAKSISEAVKGDDPISKVTREEAQSYQKKGQEYVVNFAKTLKGRAVLFVDKPGKDVEDTWYGHEPENHFEITGSPVDHAPLYGLSVEEAANLAVDRMRIWDGDKFGSVTSSSWPPKKHEAFKQFMFENTLFVQEGKVSDLRTFLPGYAKNDKGEITDGALKNKTRPMTYSAMLEKMKEGRLVAEVFYVPEKKDAPKEKTLEEKYEELKKEVEGLKAGKKPEEKKPEEKKPEEKKPEEKKPEAPKGDHPKLPGRDD